jgi:hypothetical protein
VGNIICNTVIFTLDNRTSLELCRRIVFDGLEARGAIFTHIGKTEWRLNVPQRFPIGPFLDTLAEEDLVFWMDTRILPNTIVQQQ